MHIMHTTKRGDTGVSCNVLFLILILYSNQYCLDVLRLLREIQTQTTKHTNPQNPDSNTSTNGWLSIPIVYYKKLVGLDRDVWNVRPSVSYVQRGASKDVYTDTVLRIHIDTVPICFFTYTVCFILIWMCLKFWFVSSRKPINKCGVDLYFWNWLQESRQKGSLSEENPPSMILTHELWMYATNNPYTSFTQIKHHTTWNAKNIYVIKDPVQLCIGGVWSVSSF